jgi:hypothetical protein
LPIAFTADRENAITPQSQEAAAGATTSAIGVKTSLERAMVVTQTCDLQDEDRMRDIPLVNVVPVYDAIEVYGEEKRSLLAKRSSYKYLIRLDAQCLPREKNEIWVADLRIDLAIERSLLVGREPEHGFSNSEGYIYCGRTIGAYRGRAAISDELRRVFILPLQDGISADSVAKKLVREIWISCVPGPLNPRMVTPYMLVEDEDARVRVQEFVDDWFFAFARKLGEAESIGYRQPRIKLLTEWSRDLERNAVMVDW